MKLLITLLLIIPALIFSQDNLEQQLDSIVSTEEAHTFIKFNKANNGKMFTFNKVKHKTRLAEDLFKLSKGEKKVIKSNKKKTYYKIIEKANVSYSKFKIIVFDAQKTSDTEAIAKRAKVLNQYNSGYNFSQLAKYHSSGPTAKMGGDTGWVKPGDMTYEFDNVAFDKELNTVFKINDPNQQKYYLVLRTEPATEIEEITVLKFTESIK